MAHISDSRTQFTPEDEAQMAEAMAPIVTEFRERHGDDVQHLIELLEGQDVMDAMLASQRLRELDARDAVEPLIRVMQTTNESGLVAVTTFALGKFGDVRAVDPLIHLVETAESRAKNLTDDMRPPNGLRGVLIRITGGNRWWNETRESSRENVRVLFLMRGIHTLGLIADKRAIEPIRKRLSDSDERVQAAAVEALHRLHGH